MNSQLENRTLYFIPYENCLSISVLENGKVFLTCHVCAKTFFDLQVEL